MKAKYSYEEHLCQFGKDIRYYCANNVTYAVAEYRNKSASSKQMLTFCSVSSYHQNGRTENQIKIICNPARKMLIHAMHQCPEVIK